MAMDYNLTDWEHAHDEMPEDTGFTLPEPGQRYLYIEDAKFEKDTQKYIVSFVDLDDGKKFRQFYGLLKAGPNGTPVKNGLSYKTLKSLAEALFHGANLTIPNADNIIGGVVIGEVVINTDKNDASKKYANINEYFPAPKEDVEQFSQIKQYYAGMEI